MRFTEHELTVAVTSAAKVVAGGKVRRKAKDDAWEAMSKIDAATPVANIASVTADASRLSLCTMAVATRAQKACRTRHNHLTA